MSPVAGVSPELLYGGLAITAAIAILTLVVSVLTLLVSWVLLGLYRRAVGGLMSVHVDIATNPPETGALPPSLPDSTAASSRPAPVEWRGDDGHRLHRLSIRSPWKCAANYALAGSAFALVMAVAGFLALAQPRLNALGAATSPWRLVFMVWMFAWPVIVAAIVIAASSLRTRSTMIAAYLAALVGFIGLATLHPSEPARSWGDTELPAWSGESPLRLAYMWVVFNLVPTLLLLAFRNRRIRAAAPLVLSFMTVVASGWLSLLAVVSLNYEEATELLPPIIAFLSLSLGSSVSWTFIWFILVVCALSAIICSVIGWRLLLCIGKSYQRKEISDQSLFLDALWLIFATFYSMILVSAGPGWLWSGALAYLVYKGTLRFGNRPRRAGDAKCRVNRTLLILRVFSLGKQSELLFDVLAKHWRYLGSMRLIAGTDLAAATVAPHQFLSFLGGKLSHLFMTDDTAIEKRMRELDVRPDRDGRFRIDDFFCHASTWQKVLSKVVKETDVVLMDLRNFSGRNNGCVFELTELMNSIPLCRLVLVVDASTDKQFLDKTLEEIYRNLRTGSPNRGLSSAAVQTVAIRSLAHGELRRILRRLCAAAAAA